MSQFLDFRSKSGCPSHHNAWFNKKLFESNALSALLILFDLLKNAVCIPCPINNNFELEASLLQYAPAVIHWPPGHSVSPIGPHDYLSTPWMVQLTPEVDIDHFENHCVRVIRLWQNQKVSSGLFEIPSSMNYNKLQLLDLTETFTKQLQKQYV